MNPETAFVPDQSRFYLCNC